MIIINNNSNIRLNDNNKNSDNNNYYNKHNKENYLYNHPPLVLHEINHRYQIKNQINAICFPFLLWNLFQLNKNITYLLSLFTVLFAFIIISVA